MIKSRFFSIQHSLLLLLALLLLLLLISSGVSWLAFDRVNETQRSMLDTSLPALRFVDGVVDTGAALLGVGDTLSRPLLDESLLVIEQRANLLIEQLQFDIEKLGVGAVSGVLPEHLVANTRSLIETIEQQLQLQNNISNNNRQLLDKKNSLNKQLRRLLLDIKLVRSDLLLVLIDPRVTNKEYFRYQLSTLTTLNFEAQSLNALVNDVFALNGRRNALREEGVYRSKVQKMGVMFLEFDNKYRKIMVDEISTLNDVLLEKENFFVLAKRQASHYQSLSDAQSRNLLLNKVLVEDFRELSDKANMQLDLDANKNLHTIAASKLTILLSVLVFVGVVLMVAFFFIKPRLINRLYRLNEYTRNIAKGQLDLSIEITGNDEISTMAESLVYFRDQLLEKKKVQRDLEDREQRLSTIVNNATEGLLTIDEYGFIQDFNPACEKIFGFSSGQLVESEVDAFFPENKQLFSIHHQQRPESSQGIVVCQDEDVIASAVDGTHFYASLSVTLINLSGDPVYSCFVRDVTAEVKAKQQLDQLVLELSHSNADLESFAYSCSHDLQEPIRIMSAFTQLLREHLGNNLDQKTIKYLGFIERSSHEAKDLIRGILQYSRSGQSQEEKVWVSLDDLCRRVDDAIVLLLQESNATFAWEANDVNLHVVDAQIFQLLMNLVSNGLKYNASDAPLVSLSVEDGETVWIIAIQDNGIGIDPRYHQQVFELFNRLVNKKDYSGSGIGLALCKKIVERHGGDIQIESTEGEGSCFYVRLPKT